MSFATSKHFLKQTFHSEQFNNFITDIDEDLLAKSDVFITLIKESKKQEKNQNENDQ